MGASVSDRGEIERLAGYLDGHGDGDAYEEELFARAAAGLAPELAKLDAIVSGIVDLAERGTFELWLDAAECERMRARYGERLSFVDLGREPGPDAAAARDVDIVITRIPVDLQGVDEVEVEVVAERGGTLKTMRAAIEPGADALYACCEGDLARRAFRPGVITRFWAVAPGERRLLRELVTDVLLG